MNILLKYGVSQEVLNHYQDGDLRPARVICQSKELYTLITENGERTAQVSGKFRHETPAPSLFPAVGDVVLTDETGTVIRLVVQRKSVLSRMAAGGTHKAQVVAANIDYLFLCMSLNQNFNLSRMERYLSAAWDSGATPVCVLTKSDLCEDTAQKTWAVTQIAVGANVIVTSKMDESTVERVRGYLHEGVTASFIGSSGVGKSTLINMLCGQEVMPTSDIGDMDKGRHTTTHRELLIVPTGGVVIDTPGMREFGVESVDLSSSFSDIEELAQGCKFRDCTHQNEPGCAVLRAVSEGKLDERRLFNYQKLRREEDYSLMDAKRLEKSKANAMFADVGGMKNVRKYIRENNKRR